MKLLCGNSRRGTLEQTTNTATNEGPHWVLRNVDFLRCGIREIEEKGEGYAGFELSTGRGIESFSPAGYGNSTVESRDAV